MDKPDFAPRSLTAEPAPAGRQHFTVSRAVEYFTARELEIQTGQPVGQFAPAVAPKELLDNALDAAERAGRPPVVAIIGLFREAAGSMALVVADNGDGIPPEVVSRILDFSSRTSDKAAYRGPARGAQGNALKTIIGLPVAMGADRGELEIITQGTRHRITAWLDPSQTPRIEHHTEPAPGSEGTRITLELPDCRGAVVLGLDRLAFAYACLNPHATVKIVLTVDAAEHGESARETTEEIYLPTDPAWAKYRTSDPEAPHWHDADSFARLVQLSIHAGDMPLRAFVRQFRGLTGTGKAKAVCDSLPWQRLSELDGNAEAAAALLIAMQGQTQPPAPALLGIIGEAHLRAALSHRCEVVAGRFWYRKATGTAAAPFVFEVAVAEIRARESVRVYGLNFSPAFSDPFVGIRFEAPDREAWGLASLLSAHHADRQRYALVVNLTAPGLRFLDRGKSRLDLPDDDMREAINKALSAVLKTFYDEGERARKDARKQAREHAKRWEEERPERATLRDAVFRILPEAVRLAKGGEGLPTNPRNVYYKVRPLLAGHARELAYSYFQSTLIPEYEARHGKFPGLYADPRGYLYHPHDRQVFPVGDRFVEGYQFPSWQFDKLLFVEKKGLFPILKAARLLERYDLAIVTGEGFASVAIRNLCAMARERDMRVFVLHDCDPDGYNIARTLAEETRRMPGHRIEVIDLGLTLTQARELGLEVEDYTRHKAIPATLELSDEERAFFLARKTGTKQWAARRVELNALDSTQLVALIKAGLVKHGADHKLIPPDHVLGNTAAAEYAVQLESAVRAEIERQIDMDALTRRVLAEISARRPVRQRPRRLRRAIAAAFDPQRKGAARHQPWGDPLVASVSRHLASAGLGRMIAASVRANLERTRRLTERRAGQ